MINKFDLKNMLGDENEVEYLSGRLENYIKLADSYFHSHNITFIGTLGVETTLGDFMLDFADGKKPLVNWQENQDSEVQMNLNRLYDVLQLILDAKESFDDKNLEDYRKILNSLQYFIMEGINWYIYHQDKIFYNEIQGGETKVEPDKGLNAFEDFINNKLDLSGLDEES